MILVWSGIAIAVLLIAGVAQMATDPGRAQSRSSTPLSDFRPQAMDRISTEDGDTRMEAEREIVEELRWENTRLQRELSKLTARAAASKMRRGRTRRLIAASERREST